MSSPPAADREPRVVLPIALLALGAGGLMLAFVPLLNGRYVSPRDLVLLVSGPALGFALAGLLAGIAVRAMPRRGRRALWSLAVLATVIFVVRGVLLNRSAVDWGRGRPGTAAAVAILGAITIAIALRARRAARVRDGWLLLTVPLLGSLAGFLVPGTAWPEGNVDSPSVEVEETGHRILVVGLDGADWELIEPWIAAGRLPHFARLRDEGVWGSLATIQPCVSPRIWTSMVTGKPAGEHGITDFSLTRVDPIATPMQHLVAPRQTGLQFLFARFYEMQTFDGTGPIRFRYVDGTWRRVDAIWDVLSRAGRRVAIVNWWATWPAEPVDGVLVSDRVPFIPDAGRPLERLTHPEGFLNALHGSIVDPDTLPPAVFRRFMDVTDEDIERMRTAERGLVPTVDSDFRYYWAMDETIRRTTGVALDAVPDAVLALTYFRSIDRACHTAMAYLPEQRDPTATPEQVRRLGRVLPEFYAWNDEILGEMMELADAAGMSLLVVSDHGFRREAPGVYDHHDAPPGILIARGPAFAKRRRVVGVSVRDIAPTLFHLLGLPVAEDMEGRVATEILADPERPVRRIPTYGAERRVRAAPDTGDETAIFERLRGLGYLK